MRSIRIKDKRFQPSELIADASGNLEVYSNAPANGTVQKIEFLGGNFTATGSLSVFASGTGEVILNLTSGTQGNVASSTQIYTHVFSNDVSNVTGSPVVATQRTINTSIGISGAGLGNTKSGLGINIVYI